MHSFITVYMLVILSVNIYYIHKFCIYLRLNFCINLWILHDFFRIRCFINQRTITWLVRLPKLETRMRIWFRWVVWVVAHVWRYLCWLRRCYAMLQCQTFLLTQPSVTTKLTLSINLCLLLWYNAGFWTKLDDLFLTKMVITTSN